MKAECIIVGAGTYGQVYAEYLKKTYTILGFIDDNPDVLGKSIGELKVLGDFQYLLTNIDKSVHVFVPIGNNKVRVKLLTLLENNNFTTPSFIHESVLIDKSVDLGKAVYILPATNIMPLTKIGDYVMISMGVNIAHHNQIANGCFFSQGTNVGASITIKENVFCGIGSTIMTGVKNVGANSLIGAGAVIIRDVPDGSTVVGNPGRIIKTI